MEDADTTGRGSIKQEQAATVRKVKVADASKEKSGTSSRGKKKGKLIRLFYMFYVMRTLTLSPVSLRCCCFRRRRRRSSLTVPG